MPSVCATEWYCLPGILFYFFDAAKFRTQRRIRERKSYHFWGRKIGTGQKEELLPQL